MFRIAVVLAAVSCIASAEAQVPEAQPFPPNPPIAAPVDQPYPGTLSVKVDATDLDRRIMQVQERIPVKAGPLTLLFPEWLPGQHAPNGRVDRLAGLMISANGQPIQWRRDSADVFAFHLDVPQGVDAIDLTFQSLTALTGGQGRVMMSADMLHIKWHDVMLYPAGYFARRIPVALELTVPQGWDIATALDVASKTDNRTVFKTVDFDTVVDSPLIAGRYGKKIDLDPNGRSRVMLNVFADKEELLETKPAHIDAHRNLVKQADKLFGARHFDHYDFLLYLTDKIAGDGLEHHRSSENGTNPKYFTEWDKSSAGRDLLPHEYAHSWNGKFRRPADLWTPNFNVPMRDSLLWLYEGQTQYWGYVLSARSGMLSKQNVLDAFAGIAAAYDARVGRTWKNLQDTTNDPISANRRAQPWASWQRSEDYYNEGLLVWLDADTLIREMSGGKKSLDDFARAFFGIEDGRWTPVTYTFEDIVKTLNGVQAYDWASFLRERLDGHSARAPLDGIPRGGYKLEYADKPTDYAKGIETQNKTTDLAYSLGFSLRQDGEISGVLWDSEAFKAGLVTGVRIVAVDNIAYDADRLKEAIKAKKKVELLIRRGDKFSTLSFENKDGLRYPKLEKVGGKAPGRLDDILAAKK